MIIITLQIKEIIAITISVMMIAFILPFGLSLVATAGDTIIFTEGDEGHYLGTFSFIDEVEGTSGTNIDFIDTITQNDNTNAEIKNSINSHLKVLEISDNNASGYIDVKNTFTGRLFGTVEFWIRFNNMTIDGFKMELDNAVLWVFGSKWYYQSFGPPGYTLVPNVNDPTINTWIHVKIDWRSQGGETYKGMLESRQRYTIDGISSGDVVTDSAQGTVSEFRVLTTNAYLGTLWFDAIGYGWDNDYNEGDNRGFYSYTYLSDLVDPIVLTFLTVILPIFTVIGIAMHFITVRKK